jgi:hypothetical protein
MLSRRGTVPASIGKLLGQQPISGLLDPVVLRISQFCESADHVASVADMGLKLPVFRLSGRMLLSDREASFLDIVERHEMFYAVSDPWVLA